MQVAVLGAGTMGRGIAHVCAVAGHEVRLHDVDPDVLTDATDTIDANLSDAVDRELLTESEREAAFDRITTTTDFEAATTGAGLVVEAVPERMDLKKDVFERAEANAAADAVIATNTSSMSVTELASVLERPDRAVGLHFSNPVHVMDIVEVVEAEQTSEDTLAFAEDFVDELDKTRVHVQDFPGFATSRLGVALGAEAMRMVEQGVAPPADIDKAMRHTYNHPMGPLELTDHVGLDVRLDILEYLREELGERFRPPQILRRKVAAGKHGRKTGEGFYEWEDGEKVEE
ncbi:MAG: 3-hydroxyacyl-CoA dehydrogenase family protein [Halorientalis sp.]